MTWVFSRFSIRAIMAREIQIRTINLLADSSLFEPLEAAHFPQNTLMDMFRVVGLTASLFDR